MALIYFNNMARKQAVKSVIVKYEHPKYKYYLDSDLLRIRLYGKNKKGMYGDHVGNFIFLKDNSGDVIEIEVLNAKKVIKELAKRVLKKRRRH